MPWNAKTFKKHNKALSPAQAKKASAQANAILKSTGDEGLAISVANKHAHDKPKTRQDRMYGGRK